MRLKRDKTKGIQSKSMPKEWYSAANNVIKDDDSEDVREIKEFNMSILADKKPYFFIYNYPELKKEMNRVCDGYNEQSLLEFGLSISELIELENPSEEQKNMIEKYNREYPVHKNACVMNRICWKLEEEIDEILSKRNKVKDFDYSIMKSGYKYKEENKFAIIELYKSYKYEVDAYYKFGNDKIKKVEDSIVEKQEMFVNRFKEEAECICTNSRELCDILVDLVREHKVSENFLWMISEDTIIKNLLENNNNTFKYVTKNKNGNIEYAGIKFSLKEKVVG